MPQTGERLLIALVVCCALSISLATAPGQAKPIPAPMLCKANEQNTEPSAPDAKDLIELQPNAARPTFDVGLGDKSSSDDKISFTPKGGMRVGRKVDLAADMTDPPRSGTQPFRGNVFVAAHGTSSGRTAVLDVCIEDHSHWKAGRYQGTIVLYGPKFVDFSYALVVTSKWPWWTAAGIIGLVLLAFLVVTIVTDVFSTKDLKTVGYWFGVAAGLIVGIVLGALTYFTIYNGNDTWGDDPGTQITALAIASFTAATGGLLAGRKLFTPGPATPVGDAEKPAETA